MHLKMLPVEWRQFCPGADELDLFTFAPSGFISNMSTLGQACAVACLWNYISFEIQDIAKYMRWHTWEIMARMFFEYIKFNVKAIVYMAYIGERVHICCDVWLWCSWKYSLCILVYHLFCDGNYNWVGIMSVASWQKRASMHPHCLICRTADVMITYICIWNITSMDK